MSDKEYEERLQRRLKILKKELENGELDLSGAPPEIIQSLLAMKVLPDGSVDLSTVDGPIRSLALTSEYFKYRKNTKTAIPLLDVQKAYFGKIEVLFGDLYKDMKERGANPQTIATAYSKDPDSVKHIMKYLLDFVEELNEFWEKIAEPVEYHLQDSGKLKAVFGGDLFPVYNKNIASICGLYVDTIIISDPFVQTKRLFENLSSEEAVGFFVKHGLGVLDYKDLALTDLEIPIIAVLPFKSSFNERSEEILCNRAEPAVLQHASTLFGRHFSSEQELFAFVEKFDTAEKVVSALKTPDRLLYEVGVKDPLEKQIMDHIKEMDSQIGNEHPGLSVAGTCLGRMRQATDILLKSETLRGTPLIQAEVSWKYYNWMLEYTSKEKPKFDQKSFHVCHALTSLSKKEFKWLGNIPPKDLIEIRKQGGEVEIRAMLSEGVLKLANLERENFSQTSEKVMSNINKGFAEHEAKLDEVLKKKKLFLGKDVGPWIVSGAIAVAAAVTGYPVFGLGAFALNQITDAPKLKDLPKKYKDIQKEKKTIQKSATGLFFQHYEKEKKE